MATSQVLLHFLQPYALTAALVLSVGSFYTFKDPEADVYIYLLFYAAWLLAFATVATAFLLQRFIFFTVPLIMGIVHLALLFGLQLYYVSKAPDLATMRTLLATFLETCPMVQSSGLLVYHYSSSLSLRKHVALAQAEQTVVGTGVRLQEWARMTIAAAAAG